MKPRPRLPKPRPRLHEPAARHPNPSAVIDSDDDDELPTERLRLERYGYRHGDDDDEDQPIEALHVEML